MRITLAALALLAGCGTPSGLPVLQASDRLVTIQHGDSQPGLNGAIAQAGAHCARFGKAAAMDRQSCPGQCVTQFRCE